MRETDQICETAVISGIFPAMRQAPKRIYLNVPYDEKDEVKRLGARWDADSKGWWIPVSPADPRFIPWVPRIYRQTSPALLVEMIPAPCWGLNLWNLLPPEIWREIRREASDRAGKRCEICGGRGPEWPVECDEEWEFIEDLSHPGEGWQRLVGLRALCPSCHAAKHIGKASIDGRYDEAVEQLAFVNAWTIEECEFHIEQAEFEFERRSLLDWTLDLRFLSELGIPAVRLDASRYERIPRIEGVPVALHRLFTPLFNERADQAPSQT